MCMRAPQSYIEELQDKTFKDLLEIRDKLLNEIIDFEKNIVYQWKLWVLSLLFDLLQNKFNEEYINFDN